MGAIVATQLIVGALASLPLPPAAPPPTQVMLGRPQFASRRQTERAARAAASAGVLPEISTCSVPLPPQARKAIADPDPDPIPVARMGAIDTPPLFLGNGGVR